LSVFTVWTPFAFICQEYTAIKCADCLENKTASKRQSAGSGVRTIVKDGSLRRFAENAAGIGISAGHVGVPPGRPQIVHRRRVAEARVERILVSRPYMSNLLPVAATMRIVKGR